MNFTVELAYNMKIVKITKLTKIYGGNSRTNQAQI